MGFFLSRRPGQFAAIITEGIAGRLDCHSGKRALKKNRIFLRFLDDRPHGFRLCKVCKPGRIRVGDRFGHLEPRTARLTRKPHIALWALGIVNANERYEPRRWYIALNWDEVDRKTSQFAQKNLSPTFLYHQALSRAIEKSKELNLPVVKHGVVDIVVLRLPLRKSTAAEKDLVKRLIASWGVTRVQRSPIFDRSVR
jgi:hypothetical protein